MKASTSPFCKISAGISFALMMAAAAGAALAQPPLDNKYQVGETPDSAATTKTSAPAPTAGVRAAKFDYVSGDVTWRPDSNANWKPAKQNMALTSGAQIWVAGNGRAEIRFEDGSMVRLSHEAIATLDTMYTDSQGAYTRIVLNSGLGWLTLRSSKSVFEADLPAAAVTASGTARIRIGAESRSDVAVRSGTAVVQNKQPNSKKITFHAGNFAAISTDDNKISLVSLPHPDSWDRWNDERDHITPGGYVRAGGGGSIFVPVIIGGGYGPGWHRHW